MPARLRVLVSAVNVTLCYVVSYLTSPLRKYPGPLLAGWMNYWRMYVAAGGSMHLVSKKLHDKQWHGVSGVKMGPQIFDNVFSETDPSEHARMKKPIAKYFSSAGVLPTEPHVHSVLCHFVKQLEMRSVKKGSEALGAPFDFGEWIMYFTWDVVGQATFGKPIGYLEQGHDFDGALHVSKKAMDYLTIPDFLRRYLKAKKLHPDVVYDTRILSYLLVNHASGADTTACSLKSIFYLSLKHPSVWQRLEADILAAPFSVHLPAPYAQARAIPYLEAAIREAIRLYPGSCFPQERYVPVGGLMLPDGSFVPEDTAVGFNPYVLPRNKDIWGEDADLFRPGRWMRDKESGESEEEFKARMTLLDSRDLSFGAGSRKCIGMNLGMTGLYKAVSTLIASFEFELADPGRWTIHNNLFPTHSGFIMRMRKRAGVDLVGE